MPGNGYIIEGIGFMKSNYLAIKDQIIALRRDLHAHPEVEFDLPYTADAICAFLDEHGISYQRDIAKSGICALIQGDYPGKTLLLRADMDALPVTEETGLSFASVHEGNMHACGHDIHVATVAAAGVLLHGMRSSLCGNVKLIFQPAEEGVGGAEPMIAEGIMENPHVDAALAMHVSPLSPAGVIEVKSGACMASPDHFYLTIYGKGTHGAEPQNGINPVAAGAEIVSALYRAVGEVAADESVFSVCCFNGGTATNVIPDTAFIGGTFRSFSQEEREQVEQTMDREISAICARYGATYDFNYVYLYPPVINHPELTVAFAASAKKVVGEQGIKWLEKPFMLGDDFAYFGKSVPACYFRGGCAPTLPAEPLHSPRFMADENCIEAGALAMVQFALDFLKNNE
ncbi:MAG: amidohydrolase [Ruminococcaceae bacterium]|nr:amidohydrolase [Oscillospiraceae bacterium]